MPVAPYSHDDPPPNPSPQATQQIAHADRLLLNKVDLVSAEDAARVEATLRRVRGWFLRLSAA